MSARFPAGTEFYDLDGVPVAAEPGQPPRRYDVEPPAWCDPSELFHNAVGVRESDFLAWLERLRAERPSSPAKAR